jgi:hypothetical protein
MKSIKKTLRRKLQRRQRTRNTRRYRKRTLRRQRGAGLPVPPGALVAISTGGEYGIPILMSKEKAEELQADGSLEE